MKISACMIVKNESKFLPQCLQSIQWVDEIICVDTGSSDNTIEIAKDFGAKVYEHPWRDSFSLHRNQSIQYADCDWFLSIDADEKFIPSMNPNNIHDYLKSIPDSISALFLETTEVADGSKTFSWLNHKFFRRNDFLEYAQIVHNEPLFKGESAFSDFKLHHFGYSLKPEQMRKKLERTKRLLLIRVYKDPEDYVAYLYLIQPAVHGLGLFEIEDFIKKYFYYSKKNNDDRYHHIAFFFICSRMLHLGHLKKAYSYGLKALKSYPDDIDLNYIMAHICFKLDSRKKVEKYSNKYLFEFIKNKNKKANRLICFSSNDVAKQEIIQFLKD